MLSKLKISTEKPKRKRKGKFDRRSYRLLLLILLVAGVIVLRLITIVFSNFSKEPVGYIRMIDADKITLFDVKEHTIESIPLITIDALDEFPTLPESPLAMRDFPLRIVDLTNNIAYEILPLEDGIWRQHSPVLSSNGREVIFVRTDTSYHSALFHMDLHTGEIIQLTDFTNDIEPNWSPDGTEIVFTTSRDGFQELYVMNADGSNQTRLTENEQINDLHGAFSPDGTKIAYMTNYSVSDGSGEIWLMDADGSNKQQITDNDVDDLNHVWSPDGMMLAWVRVTTDRYGTNIMLYDLASGETRQLTQYPGYDFSIKWSPDSQWIAFSSDRNQGIDTMYLIRPDGTDLRAAGYAIATPYDWYIGEWVP